MRTHMRVRAPRTRGWTSDENKDLTPAAESPAHAGMDRSCCNSPSGRP